MKNYNHDNLLILFLSTLKGTEQLPDSENEESFQGRQLVVDQSTENMTEEETLTDLLTNLEKIDMINNLLLSDQDDWDISRQIGTVSV